MRTTRANWAGDGWVGGWMDGACMLFWSFFLLFPISIQCCVTPGEGELMHVGREGCQGALFFLVQRGNTARRSAFGIGMTIGSCCQSGCQPGQDGQRTGQVECQREAVRRRREWRDKCQSGDGWNSARRCGPVGILGAREREAITRLAGWDVPAADGDLTHDWAPCRPVETSGDAQSRTRAWRPQTRALLWSLEQL